MAKIRSAKPKKAAIMKKGKLKRKLNKNKFKNKTKNLNPLESQELKSLVVDTEENNDTAVKCEGKTVVQSLPPEQFADKFPVFKDEGLIKKFLAVTLTNNQKGRIRQTLRDSLKGISDLLLPDVIYSHIQTIVKETTSLTDAELRKIRILYNMLKTAVETKTTDGKITKNNKSKNNKKKDKGKSENEIAIKEKSDDKIENMSELEKEISINEEASKNVAVEKNEEAIKDLKVEIDRKQDKMKGPKRYVVFVGNLPLDVDKEQIAKHFNEIKDNIVHVRIPKPKEGKKSSIAYVELKNELCYELALSKHHSMFGNKRLNVLYTTQKGSKISKAEAKGKSAKLVALQKSGKLAGSIPLNRKRSQRRMKAKRARSKLEAEA